MAKVEDGRRLYCPPGTAMGDFGPVKPVAASSQSAIQSTKIIPEAR